MSEMPDPNAGDDLAYVEAWEGRIRDEEEYEADEPPEVELDPDDAEADADE